MGKGLLWGSAKLLLLPGKAVDHVELQSSQRLSVSLPSLGLKARVGWLQPQDWEPPACQTQELQRPKLGVEGKGLGTVCEAPWA